MDSPYEPDAERFPTPSAMERLHDAVIDAVSEIAAHVNATIGKEEHWHFMVSFTGGSSYGPPKAPTGDYTLTVGVGRDKIEAAWPGNMLAELSKRALWAAEQKALAAPRLTVDVTAQGSAETDDLPLPVPPKDNEIPF